MELQLVCGQSEQIMTYGQEKAMYQVRVCPTPEISSFSPSTAFQTFLDAKHVALEKNNQDKGVDAS